MFLFINKAWGYGDAQPDHYFLALNYRMSELQGAVAAAQLENLEQVVARRVAMAGRLTARLTDLPGVTPPIVDPEDEHVFWKYCLRVDENVIPGGPAALGAKLKKRGVACAPRYIQKPAFMCQVIAQQKTFGGSRFPFTLARPEAVSYDPVKFPGTFRALAEVLVLPWNEGYTTEHVDYIGDCIGEAVSQLARKG
jgi:dTDP-4-amino-4,6-dideoxygalactose transaminase